MTPEDLASRGFYIFPCDGKRPLVKWRDASTRNLNTIAMWKRQFPNDGCNWGIDCGKSNIAVLDVDCGKVPEAEDNLLDLLLTHGPLPPTAKSRTISGGYHLLHTGQIKNSASNKLGKGLDTRGDGGFIVAPGSKGYTLELDLPLAPIPQWIVDIVGRPTEREKATADPNYVYDTDSAIHLATGFLKIAQPALMGSGGNDHIFRTAAHIKDFGVSYDKALELLLTHWYPRCEPNNREESLARILTNAYEYGAFAPGVQNPKTAFPDITDDQLADITGPATTLFIDAYELLNRNISIDYLIKDLIETPSTGLMFGESTAGKSFLALAMALSAATGADWLGNEVCRTGPVFYLCGEGQKGIPRRIKAWLMHYGVTLKEGMLKVSRHRIELDEKSAELVRLEVEAMAAKYGRPSLVIIDTLARHLPGSSDENSAKDVGAFINAVDYLRDALRCVMLIVHHSGKKALEVGRGSSALKAAMDFEIQVRPGIVTYTKQKDGELPEPFGFDLLNVEIDFGISSAVAVPSAIDPAANFKLSKQVRLAYDCLKMAVSSAGENRVEIVKWRQDFYANLGSVKDETKKSAFSRAEKKLIEVGAILVEEGIVWLNGGKDDGPND
jgi:hypothetical protein